LTGLLDELDLYLAVVNNPGLRVVSGAIDRLDALEERLRSDGVDTARIDVSTPVHSRLLEPVLDDFRVYLESIELRAPPTLWVSNRTGSWITPEQATDPEYWVSHLRGTVKFADCVATLAADPSLVLFEVGPGKSLWSCDNSTLKPRTADSTTSVIKLARSASKNRSSMRPIRSSSSAAASLWPFGPNSVGSIGVAHSLRA